MEIAHVVTTEDLVKGDLQHVLKKIGGDKPTRRELNILTKEFYELREKKLIQIHEQRLNDELTSERSTSQFDCNTRYQEDDFDASKAHESLFTNEDINNTSIL